MTVSANSGTREIIPLTATGLKRTWRLIYPSYRKGDPPPDPWRDLLGLKLIREIIFKYNVQYTMVREDS